MDFNQLMQWYNNDNNPEFEGYEPPTYTQSHTYPTNPNLISFYTNPGDSYLGDSPRQVEVVDILCKIVEELQNKQDRITTGYSVHPNP